MRERTSDGIYWLVFFAVQGVFWFCVGVGIGWWLG